MWSRCIFGGLSCACVAGDTDFGCSPLACICVVGDVGLELEADCVQVGRGAGGFKASWMSTLIPPPISRQRLPGISLSAIISTSTHIQLGSPARIPSHTISRKRPIGRKSSSMCRCVRNPSGIPWACSRMSLFWGRAAPSVGLGRRQVITPPPVFVDFGRGSASRPLLAHCGGRIHQNGGGGCPDWSNLGTSTEFHWRL